MRKQWSRGISVSIAVSLLVGAPALAQLVDRNLAPNTANEGIAKSYDEQIGAGRGSVMVPDSSLFIIDRDPARAIRRGRQIFQRKFTRVQGQGPLDRRRLGRHQHRRDHRRRAGGQLRRLPRPAARLGRLRRRRGHASRQPRRAAPVRPRPEGDAGRRDHDRAARDPLAGDRAGQPVPLHRHAQPVRQGDLTTAASPRFSNGTRQHVPA